MLTAALRDQFDRDGYLVVPQALSPEELARVRAAADRAEAVWRSDLTRLGQRGDALEQVQAPIEYEPELRDLLWHPRVFPLVHGLIGGDVMMIDNDYFITPPRTPHTHADWHHDVGMNGVHHPDSLLMLKVFYLLTDVSAESGGTALIPGSHRHPIGTTYPSVGDPKAMPGAIQMTGKAGDAYLFNGRVYHCAVNNESDAPRRVLIYNYGHFWMKMWNGYEPSENLLAFARQHPDPIVRQLLGIGDAYGAYTPPPELVESA